MRRTYRGRRYLTFESFGGQVRVKTDGIKQIVRHPICGSLVIMKNRQVYYADDTVPHLTKFALGKRYD